MTIFKPCIDLHQGQVKQIVGGSLAAHDHAVVNYTSAEDAAYYAKLYRKHKLTGGHIISLGQGNQEQIMAALKAWPNGLQVGGGIDQDNANFYLASGASHIIVTSCLFDNNEFSWQKLVDLSALVGKKHLTVDISCRKLADNWHIASNRWQSTTNTKIDSNFLLKLAQYCDELLVHAVDVEGKRGGIDTELVNMLAQHVQIPTTYAGGARSLADIQLIKQLSHGKLDVTIGSALDIFGGNTISLQQCIKWNAQQHT